MASRLIRVIRFPLIVTTALVVALVVAVVATLAWFWFVTGSIWSLTNIIDADTRIEIAKLALTTTGGLGVIAATITAWMKLNESWDRKDRQALQAARVEIRVFG